MQIKEMLANSSNDTKGRKQNIQYIVVHYTANNENRVESNGKYFPRGICGNGGEGKILYL